MKKCSKCKEEKASNEFGKGKKVYYCLVCTREYNKIWHEKTKHIRGKRKNELQNLRARKNKQFINDYKKQYGCKICGENHVACLDFHHRNPDDKKIGLGQGLYHSLENIKKEIEKCDILCSNCHRKLHYEENNK